MIPVIITVTAIIILLLLAVGGRRAGKRFAEFEGKAVAHRGLHKKPEIPENSLPAFALAVEKGYGIELDLHLLADGGLAVFHDDTLIRTTGKEGKIKELTTEALKDYKLEGTEETIPTFSQVLKLVDGRVPLVIELKNEGNAAGLCRATLAALEGYNGPWCIESFDPRPLFWLRRNAPQVLRGQLSQNFLKEKSGLILPLRFILTTLWLNFLTRPDFTALRFSDRNNLFNKICQKLWGVKGFVWTIISQEDFNRAENEGYISIFEQFEP